jgi:F0F1-type ATP synthase assembly protein I
MQESTYSQLIDNAAEIAAARMESAQSVLAGGIYELTEPEASENRWLRFYSGLIFTVMTTLIFMVLVGWFGNLFTQRVGPVGYFYATGLVSAVGYVLSFYRGEIGKWLKAVIQNLFKSGKNKAQTIAPSADKALCEE